MPGFPADGLIIVNNGMELVKSFLRLIGANEWRNAPWTEADGVELVRRLRYALELFRVVGGGLAIGANPLTLVIVTPDYSLMLVSDNGWFYLASNGRRGGVFEARFIKARGSAIRLTAPDALTVLRLLLRR
jgi:hypothetical protein